MCSISGTCCWRFARWQHTGLSADALPRCPACIHLSPGTPSVLITTHRESVDALSAEVRQHQFEDVTGQAIGAVTCRRVLSLTSRVGVRVTGAWRQVQMPEGWIVRRVHHADSGGMGKRVAVAVRHHAGPHVTCRDLFGNVWQRHHGWYGTYFCGFSRQCTAAFVAGRSRVWRETELAPLAAQRYKVVSKPESHTRFEPLVAASNPRPAAWHIACFPCDEANVIRFVVGLPAWHAQYLSGDMQ